MVSDPAPYASHQFSTQRSIAPTLLEPPAIDCETAALLRAWLRPLIKQADSWPALTTALQAHGLDVAIRLGRLVLIRRDSGDLVCTMRFIGPGLRELSGRLGRPMVRALPGSHADGVLMCHPSV